MLDFILKYSALQEAQDIFGVDFDYDEFEKYGEDYDEEDEEEEDDDDFAENDMETDRPRKTKRAPKKKSAKTIFEIYEPSELKRGHFTDVDNEIRQTDVPERMQLRSIPIIEIPPENHEAMKQELCDEAQWIYEQAFERKAISVQDAHLNPAAKERARKGPEAVPKIQEALEFMRLKNFEVPFIAFYRKEHILPELNINDLWKVYKYDAKWCQLKQRKDNLLKLFEKMKRYQEENVMKDLDAPLPENFRQLDEDDIQQLKNVQTTEELNDVYHHFMLYYSHEIPAMQDAYRKEEWRKRRAEKLRKRKEEIADALEKGEEPPSEVYFQKFRYHI